MHNIWFTIDFTYNVTLSAISTPSRGPKLSQSWGFRQSVDQRLLDSFGMKNWVFHITIESHYYRPLGIGEEMN